MKDKLILIGASTGGPGHLKKILSALGNDFETPIIIAQHMNEIFLQSFAKQFDSELFQKVVLVDGTCKIQKRHIYICAKSCVLESQYGASSLACKLDYESYYNPSIECIFGSALGMLEKFTFLAVLLTGIGQDGAVNIDLLQKNGVRCIAESEETAIVFGMPKQAALLNKNIEVLPLYSIISVIKQFGA
ncbi:MAG: chemotaxis protein CheB [Sulfurospirillum sp.]|nr:chemotaxis protein CheB [Sulfurospirillum sp.]